jgi:uncharacterized protein
MINVKFKKVSGNLVSFKVNGHADFDEYNRDIVCSGVSVLTYAIINGITEVVKVSADFEVRDGFSTLSLKKQSLKDIEKCQVLMETMLLGIKSMEIQYGKYITLKMEEV